MTGSRFRYDRWRREKITVLPSGMAATLTGHDETNQGLFPVVCREIDAAEVCDRGIFCPICGKRIALTKKTRIEFRGRCSGCKKFIIVMFYSGSTAVVTVKRYHPK